MTIFLPFFFLSFLPRIQKTTTVPTLSGGKKEKEKERKKKKREKLNKKYPASFASYYLENDGIRWQSLPPSKPTTAWSPSTHSHGLCSRSQWHYGYQSHCPRSATAGLFCSASKSKRPENRHLVAITQTVHECRTRHVSRRKQLWCIFRSIPASRVAEFDEQECRIGRPIKGPVSVAAPELEQRHQSHGQFPSSLHDEQSPDGSVSCSHHEHVVATVDG